MWKVKTNLVEEIYYETIFNDEICYNRFDKVGGLCNCIIKKRDRIKKSLS